MPNIYYTIIVIVRCFFRYVKLYIMIHDITSISSRIYGVDNITHVFIKLPVYVSLQVLAEMMNGVFL